VERSVPEDNTPSMPLNDAHLEGLFFLCRMSKIVYNKTPLPFTDQLALLQSRGLTISDHARAISYLQEISYYRLSAYFLPYQQTKDKFNSGVTFEQIIDTYSFDRALRLLVFDCIERIEIAIRTQIIYSMAIHYNDSHWQDDKNLFITPYLTKLALL
jgi:abortive infection bacteriophage resistance protein